MEKFMRYLMVLLFLSLYILFSGLGEAGANCTNITDSDQRLFCYAKQGQKTACTSISDNDLKQMCYAETGQ